MSIEQLYSEQDGLEVRVAGNVRAEAARAGFSQSSLARALGLSQPQVNKRWRGLLAWQLRELDAVAGILGVPVERLLTSGTPSSRVSTEGAAARLKGLEPPTF